MSTVCFELICCFMFVAWDCLDILSHLFLSIPPCQEDGSDTSPMTLQAALQHFEGKGIIDYTVGGHVVTRPPGVQQGQQEDHFEVKPDPVNVLAWKPNTVQLRSVKAANAASVFAWQALEASPLKVVP